MEKNTSKEKQSILPSINLPKGGGAVNGIGEKFSVNAVTGTGSASIPIPSSPGRNGFAPQLGLGYDSGAGNSPFGLGWNVGIPSIQRKTAKGLPQYNDAEESDTFLLSGAEDLVPFLLKDENWKRKIRYDLDVEYEVHFYRPRTEGLFARIEKWVHKEDRTVFWKTTSKENITSYYGRSDASRIYDADNPKHVFEWLLEESLDNKGSIIRYNYKSENTDGINFAKPSEQHRANVRGFNQKYLKSVQYGNRTPSIPSDWHFKLVFDYGEHDLVSDDPALEVNNWNVRQDPFSSYISGFEIRTYRLCKHILLFHQFNELGVDPVLVRSTNLSHKEQAHLTQLVSASQTGYIKVDNGYSAKQTPPVDYTYSESEIGNTIENITSENLENLPIGVDGSQYHWVDLEGEGIDGILTEQAGAWFYKSNLGNGEFAPSKILTSQPSMIGNGRPQLQDLDGDGEKELTILNQFTSGFYPSCNGEWKNYQAFEEMPNLNWQNPNIKFLDLNGDGFADILITEDDVLRWFPSKAKEGYDHSKTIVKSRIEDDGPALIFADADQSIYLADMSGGGLMDILRIRNHSICYWPNLGYGKFGAKIIMDNAPMIDSSDQFNQNLIRLTDMDGSGTTDLVYLGGKKVKFWSNESGNSWGEEKSLTVFPDTNLLTNVQFADILGKGTPCLVWSSQLPADAGQQMKYVDIMKSGKPFLLKKVINNMGSESLIHYAPSTKFYLADKKAGKPWITKLHFPVYVVEKTETFDLISNSKLAVYYKYHHGYYDGEEREFRGFGMVEQQDEKAFDENSNHVTDEVHFIPPVLTKTWFHTGAYVKEEIISDQYKTEYYNKDQQAYLLPDTVIKNRDSLDYVSKREACRALRGQVLRTEVYSLDGSEKEEHPYTVNEINFSVRQLQPHVSNKFAVYLIHPNESFSSHYERDPSDPRMSHSITIDVDDYGVVLQSAEVVYPRRTPLNLDSEKTIYPEQQELHVVLQETSVTHEQNEDDFYILGVPYQQKSFEVTGLIPVATYFTAEELLKDLRETKLIHFSDQADFTRKQKRLLSWSRNYLWNDTRSAPLELGKVTWPILPHHGEGTVFTKAIIDQVYGERLTNSEISEEGKYTFKEKYWWAESPVQFFLDEGRFYLPHATEDAWDVRSEIVYDKYDFIPIKSIDPLLNETSAIIDYRTLSPKKVVDIHGNIAEAISDELGMVIATTSYGQEETDTGIERKGDADTAAYTILPKIEGQLDDIVANPEKYLQGASSYFYYDVEAFHSRKEPPQFISLARDTHVSEINASNQNTIHIALGYSDGFGREIQQKILVEKGIALVSDGNGGIKIDVSGKPIKEVADQRWLSSGRTVYNNKEKPYKQYEPFYISHYGYEKETELTKIGLTPIIHYDSLMRVVRTDTPKGFFGKVEFNSWEVTTYDLNDTVLDSPYWNDYYTSLEQDSEEKKALDKAAKHYNTPSKTILDSLGRAFMSIEVKTDIDDENTKKLITYSEFNITGQVLTQTDPRQFDLNKPRTTPVHNFTYIYDMGGNPLYTNSIDAGEGRVFMNSIGSPLCSWTSRGFKNTMEYDPYHRPIGSWCEGGNLNGKKLIEKFVYGDATSGQNKNLQLLQHFDQTGLVELERVSFKGEALSSFKQFSKTYDRTIDWNNPQDAELEVEQFRSSARFDALGRAMESTAPDGSISKPEFNFSGQLKKVLLDLHGTGNFTEYVQNIVYNEKGQRESIEYGNNTATSYTYWEETYALKNIHTTRNSGADDLQNLFYWQDPSGNITSINDLAQQTIYFDNQVVEAKNEYSYDAFYQLIEASGREHIGQNQPYSQFDEYRTNLPHKGDGGAMRSYTQKFAYDDAGNKTLVQHAAGTNSWKRNFIMHEESNRLHKTAMGDVTNPSNLSQPIPYDENGNMLKIQTADELDWNYKNEIAHLKRATTEAWYNYDSSGQRCRKVVIESGVTKIRYYIGGFEVYREYKNEKLQLERESLHVSDDTNRIALIETKTVDKGNVLYQVETLIRYQYSNHLGSASLELDEKAQVISYEEYFPYGNTSYQAVDQTREVPIKRYRYSGMERDEESGLNYHTARYYAPWLGRWLNPDPAGTVDGLNLYRYVSSMVVNKNDTTGYGGSGPEDKENVRDLNKELCGRRTLDCSSHDLTKSIMGLLKMVGGSIEAVGGSILIGLGTITSELGIGIPVGGLGYAIVIHGADVAGSGLEQLITNEEIDTLTSSVILQKGFGLDRDIANNVDSVVSIAGTTIPTAIVTNPRVVTQMYLRANPTSVRPPASERFVSPPAPEPFVGPPAPEPFVGPPALSESEKYIVYESNGVQRIRFRASSARTLQEANPGRTFTTETGAALNEMGEVIVLEGRHRAIGAAKGDIIPEELGGVSSSPGVLDYEFSAEVIKFRGILVRDLSIDYSVEDLLLKAADERYKQLFGFDK